MVMSRILSEKKSNDEEQCCFIFNKKTHKVIKFAHITMSHGGRDKKYANVIM